MRTKLKAAIEIFTDSDEDHRLYGPDNDAVLQVITDGYDEFSSGKFRIAPEDSVFTVPHGTVSVVRGAMIIVHGLAGADMVINGGDARELRPVNEEETTAEGTPVSMWLETSANLTTLTLEHPGDDGDDAITGYYLLFGDEADE